MLPPVLCAQAQACTLCRDELRDCSLVFGFDDEVCRKDMAFSTVYAIESSHMNF